ncbi:hypothetical protein EZH22_08065 [Xanthobacter dioxanivorans]|uniref:NACHT domain-containing protein n=1 Tax=Xanthobacter dioxanivorans TaxID=2528964 RepID=A0A974PR94_9HYPH|nr:hypothetical protein [Xanthobacter dioxanivorans]QRG08252.1 hypothetical protein EZH22_08065 [Xanthobacter dioxanivorans]
MKKSWATFEDKVRDIANLIWGRYPTPENVGGVAIDAVLHLDPQLSVLIEITEERQLGKVREDVTKLVTAQNALYAKRVIARSYCVIDAETVTESMKEAGRAANIKVLTIFEFSKLFFDFSSYKVGRLNAPFGSAINPITGEKDDTEYVPVRYRVDGSGADIGTAEIAELLKKGQHIILLGEYGSGKSRCIREAFRYMADRADADFNHPISIDLREMWGLKRGVELLNRHLADLGLDKLSGSAVRAFNAGSVTLLLDGFDELGSQAWNNDPARLRAIRAQALQGVKDIIQRSQSGVLIAGREHYFPSNDEMFQALGVRQSACTIIRSKKEFTDEELQEFFDQRGIDVEIPSWLPRRPLICQTINELPEEDREKMFDVSASETAFWDHFMRVLCVRDARINVAFDPDAIYGVLKRLGRITRTKPSNVGPITLSDLQRAFEDIVGQAPGEEASVMLQRLPSLGRLGTETDDRQFTDTYILDGLRAKDVGEIALTSLELLKDVLSTSWTNGLDSLGQMILASDARCSDKKLIDLAHQAAVSNNKTLASDAIATLLSRKADPLDFGKLNLSAGHFIFIDFSRRDIMNLTLTECTFANIIFDNRPTKNVMISSSLAEKVTGATSVKGLPPWVSLTADKYESADNTASIRRIGLKPAQQMLATTIRKTFFQKGAGRKEEALTRGFARLGAPGLATKVINMLIAEGLVEKVKGQEGALYIPVRKHTGRMKQLLAELTTSNDPLWLAVSDLK